MFLKYGDSSALLSCSLKSESAIVAAGGSTVQSPTFDSVLGMKNGMALFSELTGYAALDTAGHFTVWVESQWLADVGDGSNGVAKDDNQYLVTHGDALTPTNFGRHRVNIADQFVCQLMFTDAQAAYSMTDVGRSRYTRVDVSWIGSQYTWYFDYQLGGAATFSRFSDMFKHIWIGGDRGNSAGRITDYWCKNFQISDQPISPARHYLGNIAFFGDSFVENSTEKYYNGPATTGAPVWDKTAISVMRAYFRERNIAVNIAQHGHGGHTINDDSTDPLEAHVSAMLADNPRIVMFRAGTNDCNDVTLPSVFEEDLKGMLTTILAHPSVESVVIGTIPTLKANSLFDGAGYEANVNAANAIINALPEWNSSVHVVDLFTEMGGHSIGSGLFIGEINDAFDDLHPAALGHQIMGNVYAAAALDLMRS